MLLDPPKNKFQIWSANCCACESDVNETAPVAPPMESVTILPLAWHASMSDARNEQLGSSLPEKTGSSSELHV